jgi:hypothetical protein
MAHVGESATFLRGVKSATDRVSVRISTVRLQFVIGKFTANIAFERRKHTEVRRQMKVRSGATGGGKPLFQPETGCFPLGDAQYYAVDNFR